MLLEIYRDACEALGYQPERIWEFLKPFGYSIWLVGSSPEACRAIPNLDGVHLANVILHTNPLPKQVTEGWSYKSVLRFHRHQVPSRVTLRSS